MGLIQDWIRNRKNDKKEVNDYAKHRYVEENFESKKLSADDRELMRWQEEERKKNVHAILEQYRKKENTEFWSGHKNNPTDAPNVVANQKNIFNGQSNLLHCPNIVTNQPNIFMKR